MNARAELHSMLMRSFSVDELQSLTFALGQEYEALAGDSKSDRVISLIRTMAQHNRLTELLDVIQAERPALAQNLTALRVHTGTPELFAGDVPVLNPALPQRRLVMLGAALGALLVVLLGCGFSGGLVAGQFIDITANPVPATDAKAASAQAKVQRIDAARVGQRVDESFDNEEATSFAQLLTNNAASPVSDVHVQFTGESEVSLNMRIKALNNAQVVLAYNVDVAGGRAVLRYKTGAINVLGGSGRFGWLPLPAGTVQVATDYFQRGADVLATRMNLQQLIIRQNLLRVVGVAR
jgi:hypothetical protein